MKGQKALMRPGSAILRRRFRRAYARKRLAKAKWVNLKSELGEKYIRLWLNERNRGKVNNNNLTKGIGTYKAAMAERNRDRSRRRLLRYPPGIDRWIVRRSKFWPRQLALVLSSELEDKSLIPTLRGLIGDKTGWSTSKKLDSRVREKRALEQNYNRFYKKGGNNYSLFKGETLYRLGMLHKSLGNNKDFRRLIWGDKAKKIKGAKDYFQRIANSKIKIRALIKKRKYRKVRSAIKKYVPAQISGDRREFPKHIAWANLWMANILTLEANDLTDPDKVLAKLQEAEKYWRNVKPLNGIALLEVTRQLADNLLRQGYIYRLKYQQDPKRYPKEKYLAYFKKAKYHNDYVLKWAKGYIRLIGTKAVVPRWLVNIETSALVGKAKFAMVILGETHLKTSPEILKLIDAKYLKQAERKKLEQGVNKTELLKIRNKVLERTAIDLRKAEAKLHKYGKQLPFKVVRFQALADLRVALAENLARRAFIAKELGNNKRFLALLKGRKGLEGAISILNKSFNLPKDELIRANANLWLAKIYFVMAGSAKTFQDKKKLLDDAERHIKATFLYKKLVGTMRSSALQTHGEILMLRKNLSGSEVKLRAALKLDPKNYAAMVGLADILSQQAKFKKAFTWYVRVRDSAGLHLFLRRAKLGIAEVRMRNQEKYDKNDIQKLFDAVVDIFRHEPIGSYLMVRAINGLVEANSTKENLQYKIVQIANTILGLPHENGVDRKLARALKTLKKRRVKFTRRFKALLYLKLAEATSWLQKFSEAKTLLRDMPSHRELWKLVKTDRELDLLYRILKAELIMRGDEKVRLIMDPKLKRDVFKSRDPDLITRLIGGKIEGYFIKKKFAKAIRLIDKYLGKLTAIEILFTGRDRSYTKFKFKLWKNKANALAWSKKYKPALALLGEIHKKALLLKKYPDLKKLYKAQVRLAAGDIYRYKKTFAKSFNNYNKAIALFETMKSKQSKIGLVKAYIGLAELRRYGDDYIDLELSKKLYLKAKRIAIKEIPPQNLERKQLLKLIAEGLWEIKLLQKDHDQIKAGYNLTCGKSSSTGLTSCESQFQLEADFSLGILGLAHPRMKWLRRLHLVLNGQFDYAAKDTQYQSAYMGLRFYPLIHPAASLTFEGLHKLGTGGSGAESIFYRRHDLKLSLFLWSKYISLGVAANLLYANSDINTYYAEAMLNFTWTKNRWLKDLSVGAVFNSYPFFWDAVRRDHSLAFGARWKVTPFESVEWLALQAHIMGYIYGNNESWQNNGLKPGVDFGLGLRFNIKKRLLLEAGYTHQWTQEYPIHRFMLNATYRFDLSEIFTKK
jgi:hypothetical protein